MPDDASSRHKTKLVERQFTAKSLSNESDESDSTYALPAPPDGGYGWIIVIASFFVNFIADGCAFSFGVLYTELLDYFKESKSKTSWIASLFYSVPLICGPVASALVNRFGCRRVCITGSILTTVGFTAASFAKSVEEMCFTFGVVAGLGLSMVYVSETVVVAFYFEKKRALATGLSVCGTGIGTFIFAPLIDFLIAEYGWRGTILILAGVMANMVVFGALFRPLHFTSQQRHQKALDTFARISQYASRQSIFDNERHSNESDHIGDHHKLKSDLGINESLSVSLILLPTYESKANGFRSPSPVMGSNHGKGIKSYHVGGQRHSQEFMETSKSVHSNSQKSNDCTVMDNDTPKKQCNGDTGIWSLQAKRTKSQQSAQQPYPCYRQDIFYRGNLVNLDNQPSGSNSCPDLAFTKGDHDSGSDSPSHRCHAISLVKQFKRFMKTIINISILKNPLFRLFAFSNFLLYFSYDVPYTFIVDRAIETGIGENAASLLLSIIGIVSTAGLILHGLVADRPNVNMILVYTVSISISGLSVGLMPIFTDYLPVAVLSGTFGLFFSSNYTLCTLLLVKFLGIENLTNAYGLIMMIQGSGNLFGPPVAGWIADVTGSYDAAFYTAGGFIILSGVMLLMVPLLKCYHDVCRQHRDRRPGQTDVYDDDGLLSEHQICANTTLRVAQIETVL